MLREVSGLMNDVVALRFRVCALAALVIRIVEPEKDVAGVVNRVRLREVSGLVNDEVAIRFKDCALTALVILLVSIAVCVIGRFTPRPTLAGSISAFLVCSVVAAIALFSSSTLSCFLVNALLSSVSSFCSSTC